MVYAPYSLGVRSWLLCSSSSPVPTLISQVQMTKEVSTSRRVCTDTGPFNSVGPYRQVSIRIIDECTADHPWVTACVRATIARNLSVLSVHYGEHPSVTRVQ